MLLVYYPIAFETDPVFYCLMIWTLCPMKQSVANLNRCDLTMFFIAFI